MNHLPFFLDFEASSLSGESYPIEVAWSLADGSIESHLISPSEVADWTDWEMEAQSVHGISREELVAGGKSPLWVARRMNEQLAGKVVYTDAPRFDGRWLNRLFDACNLEPDFTLADSDDLLVDLVCPDIAGRVYGLVKLWQMKQEARRLVPNRHRAAWDVEYLVKVWELAWLEAKSNRSSDYKRY
jgi:hypothetical protein